jgi:hypothetical protein
LLETKDKNDKIDLIRERIMLKSKERRKNLKEKRKNEIKVKHESESKCGRKKISDTSNRIHDKYSPDNLIGKIKNMINKSLIKFINQLINSIYGKEQIKEIYNELGIIQKNSKSKILKVIKENDYGFINEKKKSYEISYLLNLTIKQYLYNGLSSRYINLPNNYNQIIIERLLKDDNNKKLFDFIFSYLKVEDWLEIFTYKKNLEDFVKYKTLDESQQQLIENNLFGIENYFDQLYQDTKGNIDKVYFHCFLILIYNFRRFISIKENRNRTKKEDK